MRRALSIIVFGLLKVQLLNAQLNIDSLILSADSLVLTNTGFVEEEIVDNLPEFRLVRCNELDFGFHTTSKELIASTVEYLSFRPATDILFCGFNYKIHGYQQKNKILDIDYNSECNYGVVNDYNYYFLTDTLKNFSELRNYTRFNEIACSFRNSELLDCYVESVQIDERTNILELDSNDSTRLFYRFEQKNR